MHELDGLEKTSSIEAIRRHQTPGQSSAELCQSACDSTCAAAVHSQDQDNISHIRHTKLAASPNPQTALYSQFRSARFQYIEWIGINSLEEATAPAGIIMHRFQPARPGYILPESELISSSMFPFVESLSLVILTSHLDIIPIALIII